MPLFQSPARTLEDTERERPLDLGPEVVAEMDEATWYQRVYRGNDLPQLTVRAVVMGSLLGFFLAFTNIYIGLKAGWLVGVGLTACVLSFSIWNSLLKARLAKTPMSILESNCMQSTASAAGYSTGGTMTSAMTALLMMSVTPTNPGGTHLPWPVLMAWTFFLAMLGTVMAIPMKRAMINKERLRFPSGIAAAATLQSLYGRGGDALVKARALFLAAGLSGLTPLLMDLKTRRVQGQRVPLLPAESPVFDWLPARGFDPKTHARLMPSDWTLLLDHKLVMFAAGSLVGLRISVSMVVAGLVLAYLLGPAALTAGAVTSAPDAWHEIGIWAGAPMMVTAGMFTLALQWRSVLRALRGLRPNPDASVTKSGANSVTTEAAAAQVAAVEVPASWFVTGTAVSGLGISYIAQRYFSIPWYWSVLAVVLTFFLALVACRAAGESDITPIGAMGKVTQLAFGVLIPQSATANLMTASITAGVAGSSSDLLTDLKSGYLLGANPRRQFVAQFLGIFAGAIASTIGFHLLVPDATVLTGTATKVAAFPAPSAQSWLAVARLFKDGLSHLHPMARASIGWGGGLGIFLAALEWRLPPRLARWVPSATGVGLGLMLPFQYPLSMLLGAGAAVIWQRTRPRSADRLAIPLASGLIVGESIVGVIVAAVNNLVLG